MSKEQSRQYEVVLFGATGYTGKLCAQHIQAKLPHDLKWAIAGRSRAKLEGLIGELQAIDGSRPPPGTYDTANRYLVCAALLTCTCRDRGVRT